MTAHINIGSNKGDRRGQISRAAALVGNLSEGPVRISAIVESEPWGFESEAEFLNVGIEIETSLEPTALLRCLQQIERRLGATAHRDQEGRYIDRTLDIDLICMADTVCDTQELTLPHPRMHLRDFVLRPLAELSPSWRHPLTGQTAVAMLRQLKKSGRE